MQIYIYRNGRQEGPFHRDELIGLGITPETSVWYSGLGGWTRADRTQCTRWLFDPSLQDEIRNWQGRKGHSAPPEYGKSAVPDDASCFVGNEACAGGVNPGGVNPGAYGYPGYQPSNLPKPSDYMALSIVSLVVSLCTFPFLIFCGIMGIVKGNEVTQKYNTGDYAGAVSASKSAFRWSIWGMVISGGLVVLVGLLYLINIVFALGVAVLSIGLS